MKVKVCDATPVQLHWMVAMAEGDRVYRPRLGRPGNWDKEAYLKDGSDDRWVVRVQNPKVAHYVDWTYNPSGDWMQGGPIIEREGISVMMSYRDSYAEGANAKPSGWCARKYQYGVLNEPLSHGPTPLIAAMRCYVASKLGDTVDIPEELT